jgi:hypothetical protein
MLCGAHTGKKAAVSKGNICRWTLQITGSEIAQDGEWTASCEWRDTSKESGAASKQHCHEYTKHEATKTHSHLIKLVLGRCAHLRNRHPCSSGFVQHTIHLCGISQPSTYKCNAICCEICTSLGTTTWCCNCFALYGFIPIFVRTCMTNSITSEPRGPTELAMQHDSSNSTRLRTH